MFILVWFVSCVMLSGAQIDTEDPECNGQNEVLNLCIGCPPEDSCYDRNQIACPAAFVGCSRGCVCKEGFIRKTLGRECIPKEECDAPCEIFTHYSECKQCSNETCSSILNPSKPNCKNEVTCTAGCACWPGYYRKDKYSPCQHRCSCPELENTPECVSWKIPIE